MARAKPAATLTRGSIARRLSPLAAPSVHQASVEPLCRVSGDMGITGRMFAPTDVLSPLAVQRITAPAYPEVGLSLRSDAASAVVGPEAQVAPFIVDADSSMAADLLGAVVGGLDALVLQSMFEPLSPATVSGRLLVTPPKQDSLFHTPDRGEALPRRASIRVPVRSRQARRGPDLWDLLLQLLQPPLDMRFPGTLDLPSRLESYQAEGVRFLCTHQSALLGDDMGTGKTVQTVVAMRILFQTGKIRSALVVCPKSVVDVWDQHLLEWSPSLRVCRVVGDPATRAALWHAPAHVYVTTYNLLWRDRWQISGKFAGGRPPGGRTPAESADDFDLVVLDECQKIKNPVTDTSICAKQIACSWRWGLSGTPIENSVDDVVSIFEFIKPGLLQRNVWSSSPDAPAEVRRRIEPHFLRRRKQDVLDDLPPKTVQEVWVELEGRQRAAYERAVEEGVVYLTSLGARATVTHVLQLLQKLKEICNRDPETEESAKLEWLEDNLEQMTSSGDKCLIFSQFRGCGVDFLADRLSGMRPLTFTGGSSDAQRRSAIRMFSEDASCRLMLLTLGAGGLGLNLVAANYVVLYDHWWNPATMHQAADRAHRKGQQKPVFAYQLWAKDTVEERIHAILERKQRLFDDVVDSLSADATKLLTEEELFGLFGLQPPRKPGAASGRGDLSSISPSEFEQLVAELWRKMGYGTRLTPASRDQGVDVLAVRTSAGSTEKVAIQCKHTAVVGVAAARELLGTVAADHSYTRGILVTSGGFSPDCAALARANGRLELVDGVTLGRILRQYGALKEVE